MSDISSLYSKKVMEHFARPHNMGKIKNPSGRGRVGNPVCGDLMELQIKVVKKKNQEYIEDAKFQTFGCGAAIATSSILTDLIKGKTIEEAEKISNRAIIESLGGLPPVKHHCSVLAEEALQKALEDYRKKI
ncbi:MAG TPA: iron-sulfur cluster assembly scaffold protein [Patescibacteria group bacterium]|nr:iron-sulfur cluster assembly scaffold protein [Patescibacteria group bacterium]